MKKRNINEILFVLYIFLLIIIKFFFKLNPSYTFIMLLIPTISILLVSIIYNGKKSFCLKPQIFIITFFIILIFIISILVNDNQYILNYLYEFFIYGFIPIYLFSKVKDINKVIQIGSKFSIIAFLIYFYDPLINYYYFSDYMSFGLVCMLPIFFFSSLSRKVLHKKGYLLLEIMSLVELLIFCNRGSFLTAMMVEIVFFIVDNSKEKNKYLLIKIFLLIGLSVLLVNNINNFLKILQDLLTKLNFDSYSIRAVSLMLSGDSTGFSGREEIWKNAISYFYENPIIGHGIGAFEKIYEIYTHNFILETLTSTGIMGLILITVSISKYIKKCIMNENKCFYFALLIVAIIPLLFSIYIFKWLYFWILIYIAYDNNNNNKDKIGDEKSEKIINRYNKIFEKSDET